MPFSTRGSRSDFVAYWLRKMTSNSPLVWKDWHAQRSVNTQICCLEQNCQRAPMMYAHYRLVHLIDHLFEGRLPTDAEVDRLFQMDDGRSRSLLATVRSRFRLQIDQRFAQSILDLLTAPGIQMDEESQARVIVIPSRATRDELNRIISAATIPLEPMRKVAKY